MPLATAAIRGRRFRIVSFPIAWSSSRSSYGISPKRASITSKAAVRSATAWPSTRPSARPLRSMLVTLGTLGLVNSIVLFSRVERATYDGDQMTNSKWGG